MLDKIKANPKYQELVKSRSYFTWKLVVIMLLTYYTFIIIIAFKPSILGTPLGDGVTTVGIPVGIFIILVAFLLTGIYSLKANKKFDSLIKDIKEEIIRDQD